MIFFNPYRLRILDDPPTHPLIRRSKIIKWSSSACFSSELSLCLVQIFRRYFILQVCIRHDLSSSTPPRIPILFRFENSLYPPTHLRSLYGLKRMITILNNPLLHVRRAEIDHVVLLGFGPCCHRTSTP